MSFTGLKPYFKERLNSINSGALKEWQDAFNVANIPATLLDKAYHIEINPSTYLGSAHGCLAFNAGVRVRVFFKGYATPAAAIDKATEYADYIIKAACLSTSRLNQAKLKNILPSGVSIDPLDGSNDNAAILEIVFTCNLYLDPDAP